MMPSELRYNVETGDSEIVDFPHPPLATRKEIAWVNAKAFRDSQIDKGVTVAGVGVFDSDEISRSNITGAVTMALIAKAANQAFSMGWKLKDNSIVQVASADAMIAIGVAVGSHVAACHAVAQGLGTAIQAAPSDAALDAIDITSGWPG